MINFANRPIIFGQDCSFRFGRSKEKRAKLSSKLLLLSCGILEVTKFL